LALEFALLLDEVIPFPTAIELSPDVGKRVDLKEIGHSLFTGRMDRDLAVQSLTFSREVGKRLVPFLPLCFDLPCLFIPSDQGLGRVQRIIGVERVAQSVMEIRNGFDERFSVCLHGTDAMTQIILLPQDFG